MTTTTLPTELASGETLTHLNLSTRTTSVGVELIATDESGTKGILGLLSTIDDDTWLLCTGCREEIGLVDGGVCDSCRDDMAYEAAQQDDTPSLGSPWWADR